MLEKPMVKIKINIFIERAGCVVSIVIITLLVINIRTIGKKFR
jgi:hypothetical protein